MERLPNRYPKISQSHKVPLYKGLSLFYPKLQKISYTSAQFSKKSALRFTLYNKHFIKEGEKGCQIGQISALFYLPLHPQTDLTL